MENAPWGSGLAPNLIPNPPADMPEIPGPGDATARMSPFKQPLDIDEISKNLVLDRPLKLFVPNRDKYPDYEFRIINAIPQEKADAHNKGWREVDDPELTKLFVDLVAGTDKQGRAFAPILMARPKVIGNHIRKQNRTQLRSLYAGMDPSQKEFNSKYAKGVGEKDGTFGNFTGANWRIRV